MTELNQKTRRQVLFITPWYPSESNFVKGIFVKELARAVALYGEVTVAAFAGWADNLKSFLRIDRSNEDGLTIYRFRLKKTSSVPLLNTLLSYWCIYKIFRITVRSGKAPEIIHAHVYTYAVPAVLIGRLFRIPVVVSEHSTIFPRRTLRLKERWKARFGLGHVDAILPVSEGLGRHIRAYGIHNRFTVIPNTVDTLLFNAAPPISKGQGIIKKILVVGLLHDNKGYPVLFEAVRILTQRRSDFIVDVVGDGEGRERYKQRVADLGIIDFIHFRGAQPKEIVSRYMKECDFFLLPSLFETFGVVFTEALASGKPVIASDIDGPNEIIDSSNGIRVKPGDAAALAEAIDYMLDHYIVYDYLTIARKAKEMYSHESVGKKLTGIYESLLRKKR